MFLAATFMLGAAEAPPAEHVAWMKEIAALNGKINKGEDLKASATRMAEVMKMTAAFWTPKDAAAGKLATDAAAGAAALAAGTGDEAMNKAAIGASCRGCHPAHREGAAPSFMIK
jgi:hypothetical protein